MSSKRTYNVNQAPAKAHRKPRRVTACDAHGDLFAGIDELAQEQAGCYSVTKAPAQAITVEQAGLAVQANQQTPAELQELLSQHVWRSRDLLRHRHGVIDTGFAELNAAIALGGWPLGATTELGLSDVGIGELRLLMPALQSLLSTGYAGPDPAHARSSVHTSTGLPTPYCLWIAPPHQPYAPALLKLGLPIAQIVVVQTRSLADTLWAAEQALLSDTCAAVFTWTGRHNLTQRDTRRLQLAAEKAQVWHVLFRHGEQLQQTSAASLRMHLRTKEDSQLHLHIVKQPQGWAGQECSVSLPPHYTDWQRLPVQHLPHSNRAYSTQPRPLRILAKATHQLKCGSSSTEQKNTNLVPFKHVS